MTVPAKVLAISPGEIMESVIIKGDLSKLEPGERARYYTEVCKSIGLNPLTRPLEYINLNGKLTLYAKRDCADQLRKINGISVTIVSQDASDGLLTVHVRAKDNAGREDEDLGVVAFPDTLKGEARANAILKAVTKAKRRVTLSISGLGFLDETEVEDIPVKRPNGNGNGHAVAAETGELVSAEQIEQLQSLIVDVGADIPRFLSYMKVERLDDLLASRFADAVAALEAKRAKAS